MIDYELFSHFTNVESRLRLKWTFDGGCFSPYTWD